MAAFSSSRLPVLVSMPESWFSRSFSSATSFWTWDDSSLSPAMAFEDFLSAASRRAPLVTALATASRTRGLRRFFSADMASLSASEACFESGYLASCWMISFSRSLSVLRSSAADDEPRLVSARSILPWSSSRVERLVSAAESESMPNFFSASANFWRACSSVFRWLAISPFLGERLSVTSSPILMTDASVTTLLWPSAISAPSRLTFRPAFWTVTLTPIASRAAWALLAMSPSLARAVMSLRVISGMAARSFRSFSIRMSELSALPSSAMAAACRSSSSIRSMACWTRVALFCRASRSQ